MSPIENEYHKRFNNKEMSNDNFDTEGLWNDISAELNEEPKRRNFIVRKRWLLGLLLLIVFGGAMLLNYSSDDSLVFSKHESTETEEVSLSKKLNSEVPIISPNIEPYEPSQISKSKSKSKSKFPTISVGKSKTENPLFEKEKKSTNDNKDGLTPKNIKQNSVPLDLRLTMKQSDNSTDLKEKNVELIAAHSENLANEGKEILNPLPSIPSLLNYLTLEQISLPEIKIEKPDKNSKPIVWQLEIVGGVNKMNFNYKTKTYEDLANLKKSTETGELGMNFGVNVGVLLKNKWIINSGVEFQQLWSKFNYKNEENIQVPVENQLLKVWVDSSSGDTLATYFGDTMADAFSSRKIVHHNKYRQISVPIEFGIQGRTGRLLYGFSGGPVLQFTTFQRGRTFDLNSEIIFFETDDSVAPFKKSNIGFRLSPFVGLHFSKKWMINLHPQWTWQQRKNLGGSDIKIHVHQFNFQLGLGYRF